MTRISLYPYQSDLVAAVEMDLTVPSAGLNEVVLAGCPGAGKTRMALAVVDHMLATGTASRVLVLGHGTTILRDQFLESAKDLGTSSVDACLPVSSGGHANLSDYAGRVLVALPQSLRGRDLPPFDLVDEAHEFYGAAMVQDIVRRTGSIDPVQELQ